MPAAVPVKSFPFLRIVIALTAGIILQWYFEISITVIAVCTCTVLIFFTSFFSLPLSKRFVFAATQGIAVLLLFLCLGMFLTWRQNIKNNTDWYGKIYKPGDELLLTVNEPLVTKPNSYKALAAVNAIYKNGKWMHTKGNVLLYFKKNNAAPDLKYGSQIIFYKPLQPIQNSGNPAAFNYNRFCLFQNITNQCFLSDEDYKTLAVINTNTFQKLLFDIRDWSLNTLKENIHSPQELGVAEALLIGYRNDLDKDLVQAYSNTGVVHIIAISGLHIGFIYGGLLMFFSLFKSSKFKRWFEPVFILFIIWMFTLVAGAAPSILRAAVMFTCLLLGKFLNKNSNVYNTLAASAFILLFINPFYLWDVGFQLSYAAVFSIIIFFKSINAWLYFRNKSLRWIWSLCAVSLSAQIFALPLVIYHFHQLPLLFLFSNLLVVPLSVIVLFGELLLFCISFWKDAAAVIGWLTEFFIRMMNKFIQHLDKISFSVWDGLNISIIQLSLMFAALGLFSAWIFNKSAKSFIAALACTTALFVLRDMDFLYHNQQQKIIVYNIPKKCAIDFVAGKHCSFGGDSSVLQDAFLRNFNVKPSHTKYRIPLNDYTIIPGIEDHVLKMDTIRMLVLEQSYFNHQPKGKIRLHVLVLSGKIKQSPAELFKYFDCDYMVADGSIPQWKTAKWKKECEQLHLRIHSVAQDGAFVLNL